MSTHKMSNTPTYHAWNAMRQRCINKHNPRYRYYGARGITVCKRWYRFKNFLDDMGEKPQGLTIDRIDNNGNYNKKNCRWTTYEKQANNTTRNKFITFKNMTMSISQWARKIRISRNTLQNRIVRAKWPIEKAITQKIQGGTN